MAKFKRYDSYKNSGVEWLGEIPSHWEKISIKRLITLLTDYTANGSFADLAKNVQYLDEPNYAQLIRLTDIRNDFKEKGVYISKKSYEYLSKSSLFGGELLMANVGAYSGYSFLLPEKLNFKASLAPNMFLIKFNQKQIDNKFVFYALNCHVILNRLVLIATSTAQPKLNKDNVRSIFLPLPPKDEQEKIASYLDEKIAKIDASISGKEKFIELLKEQKQIIINDAVTKGLNKNAKFKNSGVEWLGQIPSHWEMKKIKFVSNIYNGATPASGAEKFWNGDIYWATPTDFNESIYIYHTERKITKLGLNSCGTTLVPKSSIIMTTRAPIGNIAITKNELCTNQGCKAIVTNKNIESKYVFYTFFTKSDFLNSLGSGTTFMELSAKELKNIKIPLPPKDEQEKIVEYIENKISKIDKLLNLEQECIKSLKEYKASLIDSVVTGKVKV